MVQLHPDPLPVGTGVAVPKLFLCVWALVSEICSLVLFNLVSSLGEKSLGLHQRLQLPPVEGKQPSDTGMGKGDRADTLQELPGHGHSSKLCPICGNCSSQGSISPSQRREGAEGEEAGAGWGSAAPQGIAGMQEGASQAVPAVGLLCLPLPAQGPPPLASSRGRCVTGNPPGMAFPPPGWYFLWLPLPLHGPISMNPVRHRW